MIEKIKLDLLIFGTCAYTINNEGVRKHVPIQDIYKMNTTVTIKYANGSTRQFVASDELEKSINEGNMFSVTTTHSDMSIEEERSVSKMYAGNPITALGNMMMIKRNAENLLPKDEKMNIVIDIVSSCIALLTDEISSYQSGMSLAEEPETNTVS